MLCLGIHWFSISHFSLLVLYSPSVAPDLRASSPCASAAWRHGRHGVKARSDAAAEAAMLDHIAGRRPRPPKRLAAVEVSRPGMLCSRRQGSATISWCLQRIVGLRDTHSTINWCHTAPCGSYQPLQWTVLIMAASCPQGLHALLVASTVQHHCPLAAQLRQRGRCTTWSPALTAGYSRRLRRRTEHVQPLAPGTADVTRRRMTGLRLRR